MRHCDHIAGEIIFVDHFGNLITNISGAVVAALPPAARVVVAGGAVPRRVRTYSDAPPGELVALVSSNGLLEVAAVQGNASRKLSLGVGGAVRVEWPR